MNFQNFLTTKAFSRNHISYSKNAIKLTLSKVEFQKFSGGRPPDSQVPEAGRGAPGKGWGEGKDGKGVEGERKEVALSPPPPINKF